jgi:Sec-independent protein translocase protein TatA
MRSERKLAPEDERAWWISLAAGLVVALVVWGLLERLRRAVLGVERDVGELWTAGKQVAQQTQAGHQLTTVRARGIELAAEAARHQPSAEESR